MAPGAPLPVLDAAQARYAARWHASAERLAAGEHYAWMARALRGHVRVLEVGTGTGQSTAALLDAGHAVVGLDENPTCLTAAARYLADRGHPVAQAAPRAERALVQDAPAGVPEAHAVLYAPVAHAAAPAPGAALLVEGNVLIDPALEAWLARGEPFGAAFDAVACWLIGTHEAVGGQAQLGFRNTEPHRYRVRVHNEVYRLAGRVLRPGGLLHLVDRSRGASDDDLAEMRAAHEDLATLDPSLRVESVETRLYDPGDMDAQVPIQSPDGAPAGPAPLVLTSVLVRKAED